VRRRQRLRVPVSTGGLSKAKGRHQFAEPARCVGALAFHLMGVPVPPSVPHRGGYSHIFTLVGHLELDRDVADAEGAHVFSPGAPLAG